MNPHRVNAAMDQAHAALRDTAWSTADEAHRIIADVLRIPGDEAMLMFAVMRVMNYIAEDEHGRFQAARSRTHA